MVTVGRCSLSPTVLLGVALGIGMLGGPTTVGQASTVRQPVYIGGFFPKFNDPAYDLLPATVQTAIDHVNNVTGLLDGYELRLRWEWSDGGPATALRVLHDFIYKEPRILMTWGPVLSREAIVVNEVGANFNLLQVGLANSPTLGNRKHYPLTLRVWEEENEVNPARVALMKNMNWTRCGLIFEESSFRQNFADLAIVLRASNITVVAMETVHDVAQSQEQIKSLKRHDARIIFIGFYQEAAKHIFCQMYNNGLKGAQYVWIVPGWYAAGWWLSTSIDVHGCTADQLGELLQNHIFCSGVQIINDVNTIDYHGFKPQIYPDQREYLMWLRSKGLIDNNWATLAYAYDALFVIALTLNASIDDLSLMDPPRRLQEFDFRERDMTRIFLRNAQMINVRGLTDHLVIGSDSARDFSEYVYIEQSQGNGTYVKLAKFEVGNQSVSLLRGQTFIWPGNQTPVDGITLVQESFSVSFISKVICYLFSSVGVAIALLFLVINIRYRQNRAIKLSSPMLNNVIVCGCLFLYATVFIFGLDKSTLGDGAFIAMRFTETALLCIGLSLTFGALFLKTYRIHVIWTNSMRHAKRIEISDTKLMSGVAVMVTLDVIIILLWIILDKHGVQSIDLDTKLDETNPHLELYKVLTFREFSSEYQAIFQGLLYTVKGLLMLAGIFLAWEIRNITIAELNDSRYIGMSIYVVALTTVITIPTLTVLSLQRELYFIIESLAIVVANTMVLCLVFVPKLALFFRTKDSELKLNFGKDRSGGTKSATSTINTGLGQTSGLMDTLMKRQRALSVLISKLAMLVDRQEEYGPTSGNVTSG